MFILRVITGKNFQSNLIIGSGYNLVEKRMSEDEFKRVYAQHFGADEKIDEKVYAFLCFEEGQRIRPLYESQAYYIMTEGGATFARV